MLSYLASCAPSRVKDVHAEARAAIPVGAASSTHNERVTTSGQLAGEERKSQQWDGTDGDGLI